MRVIKDHLIDTRANTPRLIDLPALVENNDPLVSNISIIAWQPVNPIIWRGWFKCDKTFDHMTMLYRFDAANGDPCYYYISLGPSLHFTQLWDDGEFGGLCEEVESHQGGEYHVTTYHFTDLGEEFISKMHGQLIHLLSDGCATMNSNAARAARYFSKGVGDNLANLHVPKPNLTKRVYFSALHLAQNSHRSMVLIDGREYSQLEARYYTYTRIGRLESESRLVVNAASHQPENVKALVRRITELRGLYEQIALRAYELTQQSGDNQVIINVVNAATNIAQALALAIKVLVLATMANLPPAFDALVADMREAVNSAVNAAQLVVNGDDVSNPAEAQALEAANEIAERNNANVNATILAARYRFLNKYVYKGCACLGCDCCCTVSVLSCLEPLVFPKHNCTSIILVLLEAGGLKTDLSCVWVWTSFICHILTAITLGSFAGEFVRLFSSVKNDVADKVFGVFAFAFAVISLLFNSDIYFDYFCKAPQGVGGILQRMKCWGDPVENAATAYTFSTMVMTAIQLVLYTIHCIMHKSIFPVGRNEVDDFWWAFGTFLGFAGLLLLSGPSYEAITSWQLGCVRPKGAVHILNKMAFYTQAADGAAQSALAAQAVRGGIELTGNSV